MKIHYINREPGMTHAPITIEKVTVEHECLALIRYRDPEGCTGSLHVDFADTVELPLPGQVINVSLWVLTA